MADWIGLASVEHAGIAYTAEVSHESAGGRNVVVWARCACCGCMRRTEDMRITRYSTRLGRIVGWRPSVAWPAAVRDALSAAIAAEVGGG